MNGLDEFTPTSKYDRCIEKARLLLVNSKKVCILSGAGISAESGVSTFRDSKTGALWDKFDPKKLSSMNGFEEDPALVWEWYITRIKQVVDVAKPNDGHIAIGQMELHKPTTVITQNVDDLHEMGGSHNVLHLHGDIQTARCFADCGWNGLVTELDLTPGTTPTCPKCSSIARPNVVWFGEMLDQNVVDAAETALSECDLVIVVGTSGQVYPAAGLPWFAKRKGAKIISINTRAIDHSSMADVRLTEKSAKSLKDLMEALI
jgi:NAD-dependent deacetylase